MQRIGYLIPEFPGQTHIFFWRERRELQHRGIDAELISTRRPPPGIVSHEWSSEAARQTRYLYPPTATQICSAAFAIAKAAPVGWGRCASSIARAEDRAAKVPWKVRARLIGLAVMGARLAQIAEARGWTHVHCHSCADAANIAMFAHLLSGLTYSMTLHGPLSYYGPNQREKWRHASMGITVTQLLRREVECDLAGFLPPSLEVAPMGVETERFRRRCSFEPWQGRGTLRIFSCGRLNRGKGHQDLVEAVAHLRRTGIDARLVIAGEDDAGGTGYRTELEVEIARKNLQDCVTLLGAVDESRVVGGLEEAHVFALASHNEALGVATMEAMAMAVPVVVTRVGGVDELVEDGVSGLFVPPEQPALLADAIAKLAREPELARQLGRNGRATVEAKFQATRSADVLARHILDQARPA